MPRTPINTRRRASKEDHVYLELVNNRGLTKVQGDKDRNMAPPKDRAIAQRAENMPGASSSGAPPPASHTLARTPPENIHEQAHGQNSGPNVGLYPPINTDVNETQYQNRIETADEATSRLQQTEQRGHPLETTVEMQANPFTATENVPSQTQAHLHEAAENLGTQNWQQQNHTAWQDDDVFTNTHQHSRQSRRDAFAQRMAERYNARAPNFMHNTEQRPHTSAAMLTEQPQSFFDDQTRQRASQTQSDSDRMSQPLSIAEQMHNLKLENQRLHRLLHVQGRQHSSEQYAANCVQHSHERYTQSVRRSTHPYNSHFHDAQYPSYPQTARTRQFLKNLEPPKFDGKLDASSAYEFLQNLNKYKLGMQIPETDILTGVIPYALTGDAYSWYLTEQQLFPFQSYSDFVERFRRHFQSYNYLSDLRCELERRSQGENEPLTQFLSKILEYYRRLSKPINDHEVIGRIIRQLNPTYSTFFRNASNFISLYDFKQEAEAVDAQVARAENYRPPPTNKVEPDLNPPQSSSYRDRSFSRYENDRNHYSRGNYDRRDRSYDRSYSRHDDYSRGRRDDSYSQRRYDRYSPHRPRFNDYSRERSSSRPNRERSYRNFDQSRKPYDHKRDDSYNSNSYENDQKTQKKPEKRVDFSGERSQTKESSRSDYRDRSRTPTSSSNRSRSSTPHPSGEKRGQVECYKCGGPHLQRNCTETKTDSGNEKAPSQKRQ